MLCVTAHVVIECCWCGLGYMFLISRNYPIRTIVCIRFGSQAHMHHPCIGLTHVPVQISHGIPNTRTMHPGTTSWSERRTRAAWGHGMGACPLFMELKVSQEQTLVALHALPTRRANQVILLPRMAVWRRADLTSNIQLLTIVPSSTPESPTAQI